WPLRVDEHAGLVLLWSAVLRAKPARGLTHLFGNGLGNVDAIDDAYNSSFNRHVLISDCRARCFAKRAHYHFTGSRAESIGNDDDVASRLFVEVVRMNNQKPDALEIGRLFCRPDCAYDFS